MQEMAATEPARRERKKRQTRDALVHAALKLFDAKGYEHTAVREITDAVDVSERTFFRYFASKEDLAVSFVRDATDALLRALRARPASEPPLTALRNAFRESLLELAEEEGPHAEESTYLLVVRLIDSTPSLLAAHLRYLHDHDDDIVRLLAQREGVDPETDLRPRIVAAVFGGLASLATKDWRARGGGSVASMLAAFDAYADQVAPAVAGHWRYLKGPGPGPRMALDCRSLGFRRRHHPCLVCKPLGEPGRDLSSLSACGIGKP